MTEDVTTMPQKKGSNGLTPKGQLELAIGTAGDSCDYMYLVRHHAGRAVAEIAEAVKFLGLSYDAGAATYRGLVTLKDGADPGDFGIPPRERESGMRWSPSVVAA